MKAPKILLFGRHGECPQKPEGGVYTARLEFKGQDYPVDLDKL